MKPLVVFALLFAAPLLSAEAARANPERATCKSAYGRTVCGYACLAAYGDVRCAQTPEGVCAAEYGKLVCFDPPPEARAFRSSPPPRPTCLASYGRVACGYDCKAAYGKVQCARTPEGVCHAAYGSLRCWDPPREAYRSAWGVLPKAQCQEAYGRVECGYGCVAAYGKLACARSPQGVCQADAGEIVCFDPPLSDLRPWRQP